MMFKGLSEEEVKRRLTEFGYNDLPSSSSKNIWQIILDLIREPMLLLLISCGVLYFILGDNFIETFYLRPAEVGRIQMRAVPHDLGALKADPCYFFNCFRQGKVLKGIGAVCEYHDQFLTSGISV